MATSTTNDKDVTAQALHDGLSEIEVLDDRVEWKIDAIEEQFDRLGLVDINDPRFDYQKAYKIVRNRIKLIVETKGENKE